MTRRRIILAGAVFAAVAAAIALPRVYWPLVGWWHCEPSWQGRPVSWWRREVIASHISTSFSQINGEPRRTVGYYVPGPDDNDSEPPHRGPDGIAVLLILLADADPKVRGYAAATLGEFRETGWQALSALRKAIGDNAEVMDGVTVGSAAADSVRAIEKAGRGRDW